MISLSRKILISASKESVRLYLRDLQNMAEYEPKVEKVSVTYPDAETGIAEVSGRFVGLPWKGAFKMQFTRDGGFRSEMVRGPLKKMVGGFHLRPVSGGTELTHDEQYHFSPLTKPLIPILRGWIVKSMERELYAIKEGAERLHRKLQLKQIESSL
ncbi:MAG: SRPBCC family protein [Elusimicrobia bacterium]|nr:SRPBCC family protein [Elusimicrobiota bacterium]